MLFSLIQLLVLSASSALASGPWLVSDLGRDEPASSYGKRCTAMGCAVEGIAIEAQDHYQWMPGLYRFELSFGSRKVQCEARLPLRPCGELPSVQCNEKDLLVEEMGCALPHGTHAFGRMLVRAYPPELRLEIFRDGQPIGALHTKPVYEKSRPNGPSCEPFCRQSMQRIELQ